MILVKNKWFPFGNYKAINICGIVFYKGDNLSDKTINHEKIHTKQMIELLFIFFYLWYGIEYLIVRLFHKKQNDVYHDVSFEEERVRVCWWSKDFERQNLVQPVQECGQERQPAHV